MSKSSTPGSISAAARAYAADAARRRRRRSTRNVPDATRYVAQIVKATGYLVGGRHEDGSYRRTKSRYGGGGR